MGSIILIAITQFISRAITVVIDYIIDLFSSGIPAVTSYFSYITTFLASCLTYIGWWVDALGIPNDMIILLAITISWRFLALNVTHTIKLILKLYNKLKP